MVHLSAGLKVKLPAQVPSSTLGTELGSLLENGEGADVKFKVRSFSVQSSAYSLHIY